MGHPDGREPKAWELAAIEREWPLIAADLAVLDAEIEVLAADEPVPELSRRRLARAWEQARPLPTAPHRSHARRSA